MEEDGNSNGEIMMTTETVVEELITNDGDSVAILVVPYNETAYTFATANEVVLSGSNLPFVTTNEVVLIGNSSELASNMEETIDDHLQAAAITDNTEMTENYSSTADGNERERKLTNDIPVTHKSSKKTNEKDFEALNLLATVALVYEEARANYIQPKRNGMVSSYNHLHRTLQNENVCSSSQLLTPECLCPQKTSSKHQEGSAVVTVTNENKRSLEKSKKFNFTVYYMYTGHNDTAVKKRSWSNRKCARLPNTPTAVKVLKVDDGFTLSWEPPSNYTVTEYSVYLGVRSAASKIKGRNGTSFTTSGPRYFKLVYCGPDKFCKIEENQLVDRYFDADNSEGFLFTIAASNEKGPSPIGTQVSWPQVYQNRRKRQKY